MTPKQFIRYTQMLDKKRIAICDGMTNNASMLDFWLLVFALANIYIWSKFCLLIYRFKKQKGIKNETNNA